MTSKETPDRDLVTRAIHEFDAGDPALLRELNARLDSSARRRADAIMAISQNALSEREKLLASALSHKLISEEEMLELALAPFRKTT